ncbi:MAG: patatin-like phospholipase family protein [Acidimicrobiia bacterium]
MSRVGLVLGGGGITGAAFHFGTLLSIGMATGWEPNDSEALIGTSAGAFVGAMVRGGQLNMETFTGTGESRDEIHAYLSDYLYTRGAPRGAIRWIRRGLIPALRRPSLHAAVGSPGMFRTDGLQRWVRDAVGALADGWPDKPTAIVAYDVREHVRVPFGMESAPDATLVEAVAASSAVPFVYEPVRIGDRWYADGGLASGTSLDLILAHPDPLDLVIVIAPFAATEPRSGGRMYEDIFDRVGRKALAGELAVVRSEWPDTEVVVLRPDDAVLELSRPNPMSAAAAVPTFMATLRSMHRQLARRSVWRVLDQHLSGSTAML